jgi:hypothetical protein
VNLTYFYYGRSEGHPETLILLYKFYIKPLAFQSQNPKTNEPVCTGSLVSITVTGFAVEVDELQLGQSNSNNKSNNTTQ